MEQDVIYNKYLITDQKYNYSGVITLRNLSTTLVKVGFTDFILLSRYWKRKTSLVNGDNYSAPEANQICTPPKCHSALSSHCYLKL